MIRSLTIVSLILTFFCVSCATQKNDQFLDSLAQKPSHQLLTGTDWMIISAHSFNDNNVKTNLDALLPANGSRSIVKFKENGKIEITGGCNTLNGSWSLNDHMIQVSNLSSSDKTCNNLLTSLDNAAYSLFSDKTITARVPNGIDNSLIRMQTNNNIYFVMQSINNIQKNNKSYAGNYFSDNVFKHYQWKLISAFDKNNDVILKNSPFKITTFNIEEEQLVVRTSCGDIHFNVQLDKNNINIGNVVSAPESCSNSDAINNLTNQNFSIKGQMIGKKPDIQFISENGSTISLKGSKKKEEIK